MKLQQKTMSKLEIDLVSGEEEEPSFTFINSETGMKRAKNRSSEIKNPRQKYCERWERTFPWLRADQVDRCLGICTICDKQLVCKKSHLERHQASYKHQRAMGFDLNITKQESNEITLDNDNEDTEFEPFEIEHIEMGETDSMSHEMINVINANTESTKRKMQKTPILQVPKKRHTEQFVEKCSPKSNEQKANLIRLKLLKRIDKDRNELNEYYYARQTNVPSSLLQKDTFDLFFDSISASVKALPLKLGYEFKSRVSQLLTEFELRALCEKEAQEKAANCPDSSAPVIVTSAFDGNSKTLITGNSDTAQVLYSFTSK